MNKAAQALGRLGGKAGTGEAKRRSTSFSSESAKAALAARWGKRKPKRAARRSNAEVSERRAAGSPTAKDEAPGASLD